MKGEEERVVTVAPAYLVSESGAVRRVGSEAFLRPCTLKRGGYLAVSLWTDGVGKTWPVHVLVALAFLGPRPTPRHEVAHRDGDRTHNHWRNLRWSTRAENEADKVEHGRANRGERNGKAKYSADQIRTVLSLLRERVRRPEITRRTGVSAATVANVASGRGWRHLQENEA